MPEDLWITAVAQELMMPSRSVCLIVRATQRAGAPIRPADLLAAGTMSREGADLLYPPASLWAPSASPAPPEQSSGAGPEHLRRPWSRPRDH